MLARYLRIGGVIQLLAVLALAHALVQADVDRWFAIALAALLPFAVQGVPLAVEFVTGALIDRRPVARIGLIELVAVWWGETWRSFKVFNIDQAWRADFSERPVVSDPSRPTVLLIHGFMCNRATWRHWLMDGIPSHWNVATVNLEPVFGAVEGYAEVVHNAVEALRRASGAERITLVCHSMGGLAARSYLRRHGHHSVQRVVTINTPHHGTVFATLGHGPSARQMRNACEFVRQLAQDDEPVEFVCFASQHDNLIVPRDNQVLVGAEAVWFEKIGHLAMTANEAVLKQLIEVVERPEPRPATGAPARPAAQR
jgi:predicted alpha/beta hydrolase family esterase